MSKALLLALAALTAGCAGGGASAPDRPPARELEAPAFRLERAVERLASVHRGADALWPGFDVLAVPLAVFDGTRTVLFRHPSPPAGYRDIGGDVWVLHGRDSAVVANSSAEIGGVLAATLLLDRPDVAARADSLAPLVAHEAFHVFQRARHPDWAANEADLFVYPTDDADALALRLLEDEALRRSESPSTYDAACWPRAALALRQRRVARLDAASVAYERATELTEGLATYVERRAAAEPTAATLGPDLSIRQRAYASGARLAELIDRHAPGWPVAFEANDSASLDGALARALGPGSTCAFEPDEERAAARQAQQIVARRVAERAAAVSRFTARPGPRVVVDARARPLWPQGFDPINVERVAATGVLHRRFLQLGNESGALEVIGDRAGTIEALTTGTGPHPLFDGLTRVEVAGAGALTVGDAGGTVTIRGEGLTVRFTDAAIVQNGDTTEVRLLP